MKIKTQNKKLKNSNVAAGCKVNAKSKLFSQHLQNAETLRTASHILDNTSQIDSPVHTRSIELRAARRRYRHDYEIQREDCQKKKKS
jgi:hypothetical protein